MDSKMKKKIELWQKKLLDMGMSNRLLNFKETKRNCLLIESPDCASLYEAVVLKEKTLTLPYETTIPSVEESDKQTIDDIEDESKDKLIKIDVPGDIATNRSGAETYIIAKGLHDKAKTAIEEQGVNILNLTFGFLEWRETDYSEKIIKSPLVLVPVALAKDSLTDPYTLSLLDDEIVINPTLSYKMENDFGIILPSFDVQTDNLIDFFKKIKMVFKKKVWNVSENVALSLFSFTKLNMYRDLLDHAESISKHPIVRAIAGVDSLSLSSDDLHYDSNFDHDRLEAPINVFQVVDADSSQQDAITMSKKGASFVLQGPPGTGKSQTITNIIAEALADGKKVLFVSEKMAALDVVYRRLTAVGLDDFCLVLHSSKANKKDVLDSLRKVTNLHPIVMKDSAIHKLRTLESKREKLNNYCEQLHRIIEPLNQSVFDANGIIAKLKDIANLSFSISGIDIGSITAEELSELRNTVATFAKAMSKLTEDYNDNTWTNVNLKSVNHVIRQDLLSKFDKIQQKLDVYIEDYEEYQTELKLDIPSQFSELNNVIEMLTFFGSIKPFPKEWLGDQDIVGLLEQAQKAQVQQTRLIELKKEIEDSYNDDVWALDAQKILDCVSEHMPPVQALIEPRAITISSFIELCPELCAKTKNAKKIINEVNNLISELEKKFTVSDLSAQESIESLIDLIHIYPTDFKASPCWFDGKSWNVDLAYETLDQAKEIVVDVLATKNDILSEYEPEILSIDATSMLTRFRTEYTSLLKRFGGNYKVDCNTIRANCKSGNKLNYESMMAILERLKEFHAKESRLNENEQKFKEILGDWFTGETTNFDKINVAISAFSKLQRYYCDGIPSSIKQEILSRENTTFKTTAADRLKDLLDNNSIEEFRQYLKDKDITIDELANDAELIESNVTEIISAINGIGFLSSTSRNVSMAEHYASVQNLAEYQSLNYDYTSKIDQLKTDYFFLFTELSTDWYYIIEQLAKIEKLRKYACDYNISIEFQERIASDEKYSLISQKFGEYLRSIYDDIEENIKWLNSKFTGNERISEKSLMDLSHFVTRCRDNLSGLESWIDFCRAKKNAKKGLAEFVQQIMENHITSDTIEYAFLKRFEHLWLDNVAHMLPEVEQFRSINQEELIQEFRELDTEQLKIAQSRIREKLIRQLPNMEIFTSSCDEVSILKREMGKQRKIMPVRTLFANIPTLLPRLKPCLMMSPLSVSQFLQSENYTFDMVVFDEASQIRTENAIGAISRSKQVIIAGDIHQLPPTNFFTAALSSSDEYDEEDDTESYESVLDEVSTVLPTLTLKWHYRSKDESLITFSNRKIYNSALVTFPSPAYGENNNGIEYIYVENGIYERSTKRNNPIEAKMVVQTVFEQLQKFPERSLGVITFSEAQQRCIEEILISQRLLNPQYEQFFSNGKNEPFFIKNLENVQGDERDTIIFSIGYGKANPIEKLHMNFGPLNKAGGYRRLNVAITRAKYSVKLIGSILPTDMDITDTTPKGVRMLRDYIDFAQNGVASLDRELQFTDEVNTESPFEDSVYAFLTKSGYDVVTQVGCSGYRIDMAVRHPTLHGKFVIGVECDGATYHSSRTARERDRLRQAVLESMGWRFVRIWSTDWVKDPVTEGQRLLNEIRDAINEYKTGESTSVDAKNCATEEYALDDTENTAKIPCFETYHETRFQRRNTELPIPRIAKSINEIVQSQWPVHIQMICKQVVPLYGNVKVTNKVIEGVEFILKCYSKDYGWERKGDFVWIANHGNPVPKVSDSKDNQRPIEYISTDELSEAIIMIIDNSFGITQEALFQVLSKQYGFGRTTAKIVDSFKVAYKRLIRSKKIKEIDGKISLVD